MKAVRENKIPIIIAFIQWFLTTLFRVDRLFFSYDHVTKWMLATKILYLAFLILAWCFGFHVYREIKSGNDNYKRGFFVFKVYLIITMCLLFLMWPGTWSWDDLWELCHLSTYETWYPWQHVITGAYQDVMLQILPFPGGIILLQNIIISICVAFSVTKLELIFDIKSLKNKGFDIFVKLIPFLLPPILIHQFSGYRMGLYVYVELVMLVILIGAWKDEEEWNIRYLLLFSVLGIVVSLWRTESLFYIPFICLLLLFVKKQVLPKKKKIACILILIIGFLGVNKFQGIAQGNSNYEVISVLRPCVELVRAADKEEDAKELRAINQVANLDVIYDNPDLNGEQLYWNSGCVQSDYTEEEYSDFLKAIVDLGLKYPKVVIQERWDVFVSASGITGDTKTIVKYAAILYEPTEHFNVQTGASPAQAVEEKDWILNKPISESVRRITINALGFRKQDDTYYQIPLRLIWNSILPILILIAAWVGCIVKKKWYLFGVGTAVLIRVPVVILTEPSNMLMYMLSFYLLGYVFLVYKILEVRSRKKS